MDNTDCEYDTWHVYSIQEIVCVVSGKGACYIYKQMNTSLDSREE